MSPASSGRGAPSRGVTRPAGLEHGHHLLGDVDGDGEPRAVHLHGAALGLREVLPLQHAQPHRGAPSAQRRRRVPRLHRPHDDVRVAERRST